VIGAGFLACGSLGSRPENWDLVQESVLAEKRHESGQDSHSAEESFLDEISDDDELEFARAKNWQPVVDSGNTMIMAPAEGRDEGELVAMEGGADNRKYENMKYNEADVGLHDSRGGDGIDYEGDGYEMDMMDTWHGMEDENEELDAMFNAEDTADWSSDPDGELYEDGVDTDMLDIPDGMGGEEMDDEETEFDMMFSEANSAEEMLEHDGGLDDAGLDMDMLNDEDGQDTDMPHEENGQDDMDMLEIPDSTDDEIYPPDDEDTEFDMMFSAENKAGANLKHNNDGGEKKQMDVMDGFQTDKDNMDMPPGAKEAESVTSLTAENERTPGQGGDPRA